MEEKDFQKDGNATEKKEVIKESWWKRKTKGQKAGFIIALALLTLSIFFIITLIFAKEVYGEAVFNAVYGKDAEGNYFSSTWAAISYKMQLANGTFVASLLTIAFTFLNAFVLDFIVKLCTMNGSRRARTTGSLIRSLIKYLAVLIGASVLLTIWGVDVTGVVASIGVLTLIIGLGCQSLISDIISGLFIVFDDYFSVGDMVIVDGFRGYVTEIGLRAVKIDDNCGNIKSINNGSITSVVNLSRQPNFIMVNMAASYNEDVERCESVFAKELPLIKDRLPQIIDGPIYKGIDDFNNSGISFAFAFTCKAEYRFQATRDVKREIYQMFVRNNIIVPYAQITVNQPDPKDRPKASAEDKKNAEELLKKNRAKKAPTKKVKLSQKLAKAYDETLKEVDKEIKH